ncbi:auxilin-like protein, partial [Trifolium medium]|nr:auxilin-like protein [Trifolium medium]
RPSVFVKKDAPVKFLADPQKGRSMLRPTDVLVYGWIGGKHVYVDLTEVFSLVGLRTKNFIVGQAALEVASSKVKQSGKI